MNLNPSYDQFSESTLILWEVTHLASEEGRLWSLEI
jgi:hypothetical protein